ncbi:galactokinase [Lentzea sp. JNUCC 0626]|uniref:galactokinase n=1 Tax=Lentzea sp. JNUCC 0626 TaxID=3367513 RepID=UPI003747FE54
MSDVDEMAEVTAGLFRAFFRTDADGVWFAPGGVNLIGGLPGDGLALQLALPRGVRVAARLRDDEDLRIVSSQHSGIAEIGAADLVPGDRGRWYAYVAGVVWALRRNGHLVGGFDLLFHGDVPTGAGFASSGALACATALAVAELSHLSVSRLELMSLVREAETGFVGVPDAAHRAAAFLARRDHLLVLDPADAGVEHVAFTPASLGMSVLVIDARLRPSVTVRHPGVPYAVMENERVAEAVELVKAGRLRAIGGLMTASHLSLRFDCEVAVPELDLALIALLGAGAFGARMNGGSVLALIEEDRAGTCLAAVRAGFERHGFAEPDGWTTVASEGAHRVRG